MIGLAVAACSDSSATRQETVIVHPVTVHTLSRQNEFSITRDFAGLVITAQSTDIGFELAGKAVELAVDEGETVQQGQILARMDVQLLQAERDELTGQKQELQAQLELNQLDTDRISELKQNNFASQQRFDQLRTEKASLQARLGQVNASLDANATRLDKSVLRSPFSATVSRRFVDQGTVVQAGDPVFRLLDAGPLEARVGLPVRVLDSVQPGDAVEMSVGGQPYQGVVIARGRDVTRSTLTVPVRVALPLEVQAVAGDQAYLRLDESIAQEGFWVPLEALTDGLRGLWNLYVVIDGAAGSPVLEARDVRVLYADQTRAFVSGAVTDGESIVSSGLHRLVPGQTVRVQQPMAMR
ncbi:MAG: efflux RND transporter periplasmic adaptor subunit [Xanthomonadales bacterium]|nr:efflux RND transporter periplasmic adaptor subunit [Xanthomonadales bacterium]